MTQAEMRLVLGHLRKLVGEPAEATGHHGRSEKRHSLEGKITRDRPELKAGVVTFVPDTAKESAL